MNTKVVDLSWRNAGFAIAFLLLLAAVFYRQTIIYLADLWNDLDGGEYAHGYLVLAISAYLIFSNRKRLAEVSPCPSYAVLPLVLFSSLSWLVAVLVDVEVLQSIGLLLVLLTTVWAIAGHQVMRLLAFPILFVVFAIPVWFPLSPLLQDITADVVFWITRLIEIPAFRQENWIVVPAGIFSIEEACSGLRYLLASLTLGSLYAYMNYVTLPARVAVVVVAAVTALVANIIRVFMVVYVGYTTEMQHPWVSDHMMLGWYVFGTLVAILLFLDTRYYRAAAVAEEKDGSCLKPAGSCESRPIQLALVVLLSALFIAAGPLLVYQNNNQKYPATSDSMIVMPSGVDGWMGPAESGNDWLPIYKGAIAGKADYSRQAESVSLFVAYYLRQKQGEEVINVNNRISNRKVWRPKYTRARNRQVLDYDINEQLLEKGKLKKRLVWYWYVIGGQVTTNKYEAKVLQLAAILKGTPQAYLVAVSAEVADEKKVARDILREFVTAMQIPLADLRIDERTGK